MDNYIGSNKEYIFKNVSILIYVFDIDSSTEKHDHEDYLKCIEYLNEFSQNAKIFCLIHKMDLLPAEQRERIFQMKSIIIAQMSLPLKIKSFQTSIWHDSLYNAWASIIYSMIPNSDLINSHLLQFVEACDADEVILFEKASFLDICHTINPSSTRLHHDHHRFGKISNIIKLFKINCSKNNTSLNSIHIHDKTFETFIFEFTKTTYIMLVVSDPQIKTAIILMNIRNVRSHFESLLSST